jgi:hypothetical protein
MTLVFKFILESSDLHLKAEESFRVTAVKTNRRMNRPCSSMKDQNNLEIEHKRKRQSGNRTLQLPCRSDIHGQNLRLDVGLTRCTRHAKTGQGWRTQPVPDWAAL